MRYSISQNNGMVHVSPTMGMQNLQTPFALQKAQRRQYSLKGGGEGQSGTGGAPGGLNGKMLGALHPQLMAMSAAEVKESIPTP